MNVIEFYSDDVLDVVGLGQTSQIFDETEGDYIKMELRDAESNVILHTFYSNRLLFEHEVGNYYFEDYHYNKTTEHFMEGSEHIDEPHGNLLPSRFNKPLHDGDNSFEIIYTYKKQINIYRDGRGRIYIKPNEVIGKINLEENKYKLRLYFLRDIKSGISKYLQIPKVFEAPVKYINSPSPTQEQEIDVISNYDVMLTPKLIPLYRFWNAEKQRHHYTIDEREYNNLKSNPNYKNWKFERIECYIPNIDDQNVRTQTYLIASEE